MSQRLYVGNLSFSVTTDQLRAAFSDIGDVSDAHVVTDRETGRSRGFGFVTMGTEQLAQKAIQEKAKTITVGAGDAAIELLRAKAGQHELEFAHRLDAHDRMNAALRGLLRRARKRS